MAEAEVERDHDQLLADEIVAALEDADVGDPFLDPQCPSCGLHYEAEAFVPVRVGEEPVGECCRYCASAIWDVDEATIADTLREEPLTTNDTEIYEHVADWASDVKSVGAAIFGFGVPLLIVIGVASLMLEGVAGAMNEIQAVGGPAFGAPLPIEPFLLMVVGAAVLSMVAFGPRQL